MLETLKNAFRIKDIRKKLFFTFCMMVVIRMGCQLPVPGVNRNYFSQWFAQNSNDAFNFFSAFTGGSFEKMSIFALSITPYITSSIIIQLLTIAIPALEEMHKDGEDGRKKIAAITRYVTVALALIESIAMTVGFGRSGMIPNITFLKGFEVVVALTAGSAFLMWIGERITEKGVGNGISIVLMINILSSIPADITGLFEMFVKGKTLAHGALAALIIIAVILVTIVMVIVLNDATRKIPVQYAKRVVGRKMYGGQATHIPLKVNQAGVIPVIFAMSFLQFPLTITYFMNSESGAAAWIEKWLSPTGTPGVWVYAAFNVVLIIFFTYFYTSVTFNPVEVAQNMKANGGFIPGIRPGKATVEYLNRVMTRITFVGAVFLAAVAILPTIVSQLGGLNFHFGGTSLLIAVGVALDTMKQLENQMVMRNYQGFLK